MRGFLTVWHSRIPLARHMGLRALRAKHHKMDCWGAVHRKAINGSVDGLGINSQNLACCEWCGQWYFPPLKKVFYDSSMV